MNNSKGASISAQFTRYRKTGYRIYGFHMESILQCVKIGRRTGDSIQKAPCNNGHGFFYACAVARDLADALRGGTSPAFCLPSHASLFTIRDAERRRFSWHPG